MAELAGYYPSKEQKRAAERAILDFCDIVDNYIELSDMVPYPSDRIADGAVKVLYEIERVFNPMFLTWDNTSRRNLEPRLWPTLVDGGWIFARNIVDVVLERNGLQSLTTMKILEFEVYCRSRPSTALRVTKEDTYGLRKAVEMLQNFHPVDTDEEATVRDSAAALPTSAPSNGPEPAVAAWPTGNKLRFADGTSEDVDPKTVRAVRYLSQKPYGASDKELEEAEPGATKALRTTCKASAKLRNAIHIPSSQDDTWAIRSFLADAVSAGYLGVSVDSEQRMIRRLGFPRVEVDLSHEKRLWNVFEQLYSQRGIHASRDNLLVGCWGSTVVGPNNVYVAIKDLNAKIAVLGISAENSRNLGWALVETSPVEEASPAEVDW